MAKKIFTEDLFPTTQVKDEVVELMYEKKRKFYLNIGLMFFYFVLLIVSLFIF